jgi:hypothetical protein
MVDETIVDSALDVLRPALTSNGFSLRAGKVSTDGVVEVILEAGPEACLDCLVPEDVMIGVLDDAIRQQDPGFARVKVVRHGFE